MRKKISKLEKNACSDSPHLFRFAPIDGISRNFNPSITKETV